MLNGVIAAGRQVEGSCQRLCQGLAGEMHRLALQVQVLEEADTLAVEAEAVPLPPYYTCY